MNGNEMMKSSDTAMRCILHLKQFKEAHMQQNTNKDGTTDLHGTTVRCSILF